MHYALWTVLEQLRSDQYEWVELSHSLNNDSPFWSGIPAGSVELAETCFDWGNPMLECLIQTFKFPGQFGTHIDFPGHFVKDAPLSEAYGTESMLFPLCVIDISRYGAIPEGAFVALRTDWYKRWPSMEKMSNVGADGNEHCPGWSLEALRYIYETRRAAANGHETLDTDASQVAAAAGDLVCERYVLARHKLQIEVLANLDKTAPAGALLLAAWPRIEGATGLPARVYAITPKSR